MKPEVKRGGITRIGERDTFTDASVSSWLNIQETDGWGVGVLKRGKGAQLKSDHVRVLSKVLQEKGHAIWGKTSERRGA